MTTHPDPHAEKVARLRELIGYLNDTHEPLINGGDGGCLRCQATLALREYADLLEVLQGWKISKHPDLPFPAYVKLRRPDGVAVTLLENDVAYSFVLAVAPLLAANHIGKEK